MCSSRTCLCPTTTTGLGSLGFSLGNPPGETEKDIIERGAAQSDVVDPDAGTIECAHRINEHGRTTCDRKCDAPLARLDRGLCRSNAGQSSHCGRNLCIVVQHHLNAVGTDTRFQLVTCSLGDDATMVNDNDAVSEPVRLLKILGGQKHGRSLVDQIGDHLPHALT